MSIKIMPPVPGDDTTQEDRQEIARLEALSPELRELAARHALDQFDAVPSYIERFACSQSD